MSFFTHEKATRLSGSTSPENKASFATYSPGIMGVFAGTIIIVCALFSKTNHGYQPQRTPVHENIPIEHEKSSLHLPDSGEPTED